MNRSKTCPQCNSFFMPQAAEAESGLFCPECWQKIKQDTPAVSVELPSNYSNYVEGRDLVIKKGWRKISVFIGSLVVFFIWVNLFLAIISSIFMSRLTDGGFDFSEEPFQILFALVFLIIGLFIFYKMIGCLVNVTETRIDDRSITIRTYPFPMSAKKVLESYSVEQIYCKKIDCSGYKGRPYKVYELMAVLKGDRRVSLDKFTNIYHARAYEKLMEKRLGIKNASVDDEYTV